MGAVHDFKGCGSMGVYLNFVCPGKRQFLDGMSKFSELRESHYALATGLLMCDEQRVTDGPLAIAGRWAGYAVYLVGDSGGAELTDLGLTALAQEAALADPIDQIMLSSLYYFARRRFEDVADAALAAVNELLPAGDSPVDGGTTASPRVAGAYGAGEAYCIVCPSEWQYIDPRRLGERPTIDRVLLGWPGRLVTRLMLEGLWRGPMYAAGERSQTFPAELPVRSTTRQCRNLFEVAAAEYEDVTLAAARTFQWADELATEAESNDALLVALGDAAYGPEGSCWQAALARTFGQDWPKHWASAQKRCGR